MNFLDNIKCEENEHDMFHTIVNSGLEGRSDREDKYSDVVEVSCFLVDVYTKNSDCLYDKEMDDCKNYDLENKTCFGELDSVLILFKLLYLTPSIEYERSHGVIQNILNSVVSIMKHMANRKDGYLHLKFFLEILLDSVTRGISISCDMVFPISICMYRYPFGALFERDIDTDIVLRNVSDVQNFECFITKLFVLVLRDHELLFTIIEYTVKLSNIIKYRISLGKVHQNYFDIFGLLLVVDRFLISENDVKRMVVYLTSQDICSVETTLVVLGNIECALKSYDLEIRKKHFSKLVHISFITKCKWKKEMFLWVLNNIDIFFIKNEDEPKEFSDVFMSQSSPFLGSYIIHTLVADNWDTHQYGRFLEGIVTHVPFYTKDMEFVFLDNQSFSNLKNDICILALSEYNNNALSEFLLEMCNGLRDYPRGSPETVFFRLLEIVTKTCLLLYRSKSNGIVRSAVGMVYEHIFLVFFSNMVSSNPNGIIPSLVLHTIRTSEPWDMSTGILNKACKLGLPLLIYDMDNTHSINVMVVRMYLCIYMAEESVCNDQVPMASLSIDIITIIVQEFRKIHKKEKWNKEVSDFIVLLLSDRFKRITSHYTNTLTSKPEFVAVLNSLWCFVYSLFFETDIEIGINTLDSDTVGINISWTKPPVRHTDSIDDELKPHLLHFVSDIFCLSLKVLDVCNENAISELLGFITETSLICVDLSLSTNDICFMISRSNMLLTQVIQKVLISSINYDFYMAMDSDDILQKNEANFISILTHLSCKNSMDIVCLQQMVYNASKVSSERVFMNLLVFLLDFLNSDNCNVFSLTINTMNRMARDKNTSLKWLLDITLFEFLEPSSSHLLNKSSIILNLSRLFKDSASSFISTCFYKMAPSLLFHSTKSFCELSEVVYGKDLNIQALMIDIIEDILVYFIFYSEYNEAIEKLAHIWRHFFPDESETSLNITHLIRMCSHGILIKLFKKLVDQYDEVFKDRIHYFIYVWSTSDFCENKNDADYDKNLKINEFAFKFVSSDILCLLGHLKSIVVPSVNRFSLLKKKENVLYCLKFLLSLIGNHISIFNTHIWDLVQISLKKGPLFPEMFEVVDMLIDLNYNNNGVEIEFLKAIFSISDILQNRDVGSVISEKSILVLKRLITNVCGVSTSYRYLLTSSGLVDNEAIGNYVKGLSIESVGTVIIDEFFSEVGVLIGDINEKQLLDTVLNVIIKVFKREFESCKMFRNYTHIYNNLWKVYNNFLNNVKEYAEETILLVVECISLVSIFYSESHHNIIQPDIIEKSGREKIRDVVWLLDTDSSILKFIFYLVENVYIKNYTNEKHIQTQDLIAFVIQEILKVSLKITRTSNRCKNSLNLLQSQLLNYSQDRDGGGSDEFLGEEFLSLSKENQDFLKPFMKSKYKIQKFRPVYYDEESVHILIFDKNITYGEWIFRFIRYLTTFVSKQEVRDLFSICVLLCKYDDKHSLFLLSFLVNHLLVTSNKYRDIMEHIKKEFHHMVKALSNGSPVIDDTDKCKFYDCIVGIMEIMESKVEPHYIYFDFSLGAVLDLTVNNNDYYRAIYYGELLLRKLKNNNPDSLSVDRSLLFIQKAEVCLDNWDAVEGLDKTLESLSLKSRALAMECKEDYETAISFYEFCVKKQPQDLACFSGLLRCHENSGNHESAYYLLKSNIAKLPKSSALRDKCLEYDWRLGIWDEFHVYKDNVVLKNAEMDVCDIYRSSFDYGLSCLMNIIHFKEVLDLTDVSRPLENLRKSFFHEAKKYGKGCLANKMKILNIFQALECDLESGRSVQNGLFSLYLNRMMSRGVSPPDEFGMASTRTGLEIFVECKKYIVERLLKDNNHWTYQNICNELSKLYRRNKKYNMSNKTLLEAKYGNVLSGNDKSGYKHYSHVFNDQILEGFKLLWDQGNHNEAIERLDAHISTFDWHEDQHTRHIKSTHCLRLSRWMVESRFGHCNKIIYYFEEAIKNNPDSERAYYHLFKFQLRLLLNSESCYRNRQGPSIVSNINSANTGLVIGLCRNLSNVIMCGRIYVYECFPKLLTIWLDIASSSMKHSSHNGIFLEIDHIITALVKDVSPKKLLSCISQIASRICHPRPEVYLSLETMLLLLVNNFPQHTLWNLVAVSRSTISTRLRRCMSFFDKCKNTQKVRKMIGDISKFSEQLSLIANHPGGSGQTTLSICKNFKGLHRIFPLCIGIPSNSEIFNHEHMGSDCEHATATVHYIQDTIEVMFSLQKPKKISIVFSDGTVKPFLCKAKDDLRKDSRFMELSYMVNRLLIDNSDSRKRNMHLKPYCVFPLNEECGIIEWVPNTTSFRHIILGLYKKRGISYPSHSDVKNIMASTEMSQRELFTSYLLPKHPSVLYAWFLNMFKDHESWYHSRNSFIRSCATISIVGYIMGLGDRHGENILLDSSSGDAVHVDFSCLFEKGLTFEKPERVPFRLTHNMIDSFGPSGHKGIFHRCAVITMKVLRQHRDLLINILETFIYDPLVEWGNVRKGSDHMLENPEAREILSNIEKNLMDLLEEVSTSLCQKMVTQIYSYMRQLLWIISQKCMWVGHHSYKNVCRLC